MTLRIGAPTVSHHVKTLVGAGLITVERQGRLLVRRPDPRTAEMSTSPPR